MATGKGAKLCKSLECAESKPMGSDLRMYETMAAAALGEALYNIFYFHECMRQSKFLSLHRNGILCVRALRRPYNSGQAARCDRRT